MGITFAAMIVGGWIIYARTKKRVRIKQDVPNDQQHTASIKPTRSTAGVCPGVIMAFGIGAAAYYQVGSYGKVADWHLAYQQAPALLDRALDPQSHHLILKKWSALR